MHHYLTIPLVLCLSSPLLAQLRTGGTIVEVKPGALTVEDLLGKSTLRVTSQTAVRLDGKPANVNQLKPGQSCEFTSQRGIVVRMFAFTKKPEEFGTPHTDGDLTIRPLRPSPLEVNRVKRVEIPLSFENTGERKKIDLTPWAKALQESKIEDDLGNTYKRLSSGFPGRDKSLQQEVNLVPNTKRLGQIISEEIVGKAKAVNLTMTVDGKKVVMKIRLR